MYEGLAKIAECKADTFTHKKWFLKINEAAYLLQTGHLYNYLGFYERAR